MSRQFIQVTTKGNEAKMAVNVKYIVSFSADGNGCRIWLTGDDDYVRIHETFDEVWKEIERATAEEASR